MTFTFYLKGRAPQRGRDIVVGVPTPPFFGYPLGAGVQHPQALQDLLAMIRQGKQGAAN